MLNGFSDLVVFGYKGVKRVALNGLGKINVLCGPNNSGKTSVLEAVANENHRATGFRPNAQSAAEIEGDYLGPHTRWSYGDMSNSFRGAVSTALSPHEVWYPDQFDEFFGSVVDTMRQQRGMGLDHPSNLKNAMARRLPPHPLVTLVSAKRQLGAQTAVNSSERVTPNGAGLLNYLFTAKNSLPDSEARKRFLRILGAFSEITGDCTFDVYIIEQNQLQLKFQRGSGAWINADDCGLGFRDLLIILYFGIAGDANVVLIEEPENHQHPEIQRKLVAFLREKTDKQFFLSTHSSVFSNPLYADRVFNCRIDGVVHVENATSRASLLASMGYSVADNLVSDIVVLVEGPTDALILQEFFAKMGMIPKFSIKLWPLGGDIMGRLDLSVFSQSYRLVALIDKDPESRRIREAFKSECQKLNIRVHQLSRYAIENYLSLKAILAVTFQPAPGNLTQLDPNTRVADQLGFNVKGNAAQIARAMTIDDIVGSDLHDFLVEVEKLLIAAPEASRSER